MCEHKLRMCHLLLINWNKIYISAVLCTLKFVLECIYWNSEKLFCGGFKYSHIRASKCMLRKDVLRFWIVLGTLCGWVCFGTMSRWSCTRVMRFVYLNPCLRYVQRDKKRLYLILKTAVVSRRIVSAASSAFWWRVILYPKKTFWCFCLNLLHEEYEAELLHYIKQSLMFTLLFINEDGWYGNQFAVTVKMTYVQICSL
jgi:hypothetical protein